jgi:hypothetical protein
MVGPARLQEIEENPSILIMENMIASFAEIEPSTTDLNDRTGYSSRKRWVHQRKTQDVEVVVPYRSSFPITIPMQTPANRAVHGFRGTRASMSRDEERLGIAKVIRSSSEISRLGSARLLFAPG